MPTPVSYEDIDSDLPCVSIIIVTFNGERFVEPLIQSLEGQSYERQKVELIVVDNASSDRTREIATSHPDVRLIALDSNLGFAAANNIAQEAASHEYLVFLNQDTLCHRHWLSGLVRAFLSAPEIGAVASNMLLPSAPEFHSLDLGCPPMDMLYFMDLSIFGFGAYRSTRASCICPRIISGCSFITSRAVIRDVGGLFDETLWMYVEDTDFSLRLVNKGYKIIATADSIVYHLHAGDGTFSTKRALTAARAIRNRVVVFFKNMSLAEHLLYLPLLFFGGPLKLQEKPFAGPLKPILSLVFALFSMLVMTGSLLQLGRYNKKRLAVLKSRKGGMFLILRHMLKSRM